MRPPFCDICGEGCDEEGLVIFRKRPSDEEWDRWIESEGGVGHPPYAGWFCPKHIGAARALQHLTIDEAYEAMGR